MANLFLHLSTQWHRAGMGGAHTGLNYEVIPAIAGIIGLTMTPARLTDLRIMEHEALRLLSTRR